MKVGSQDRTPSFALPVLFVQNYAIFDLGDKIYMYTGGGGFQNVAFLLLSNRTML